MKEGAVFLHALCQSRRTAAKRELAGSLRLAELMALARW
jgi:hypothetical protein